MAHVLTVGGIIFKLIWKFWVSKPRLTQLRTRCFEGRTRYNPWHAMYGVLPWIQLFTVAKRSSLNWTDGLFQTCGSIKIGLHDNTVTTKDMYIHSKVFTKFHVRAIDTIAGCHSIVLLTVLESLPNSCIYTVSKKTVHFCLSELRQIFTNFNKFY